MAAEWLSQTSKSQKQVLRVVVGAGDSEVNQTGVRVRLTGRQCGLLVFAK